jgi:hypothetical protein
MTDQPHHMICHHLSEVTVLSIVRAMDIHMLNAHSDPTLLYMSKGSHGAMYQDHCRKSLYAMSASSPHTPLMVSGVPIEWIPIEDGVVITMGPVMHA